MLCEICSRESKVCWSISCWGEHGRLRCVCPLCGVRLLGTGEEGTAMDWTSRFHGEVPSRPETIRFRPPVLQHPVRGPLPPGERHGRTPHPG